MYDVSGPIFPGSALIWPYFGPHLALFWPPFGPIFVRAAWPYFFCLHWYSQTSFRLRMDRVIDRLYIGDLKSATAAPSNPRITHVVNLSGFQYYVPPRVFYLQLPIPDLPSPPITPYFGMTNKFIDEGRRTGNVLVHCYAGRSRSATIVIAYLMYSGASFKESLALLKNCRPIIQPNSGFLRELENYQPMTKKRKADGKGETSASEKRQRVSPNPVEVQVTEGVPAHFLCPFTNCGRGWNVRGNHTAWDFTAVPVGRGSKRPAGTRSRKKVKQSVTKHISTYHLRKT